jgi:hypothetical protein
MGEVFKNCQAGSLQSCFGCGNCRQTMVEKFVRTGRKIIMDSQHTNSWPDLAVGLYERLTGRNAEIEYNFVDMHVKIPSGTGPKAEHAEWVFSGTLKIRTRDQGPNPN